MVVITAVALADNNYWLFVFYRVFKTTYYLTSSSLQFHKINTALAFTLPVKRL